MPNSYELQMKALTKLNQEMAESEKKQRDEQKLKAYFSGAQNLTDLVTPAFSTATAAEILAKQKPEVFKTDAFGQAADSLDKYDTQRDKDILERYKRSVLGAKATGLEEDRLYKRDMEGRKMSLAEQKAALDRDKLDLSRDLGEGRLGLDRELGLAKIAAARAKARRGGGPRGEKLSVGEQAVDKAFAKEYVDFFIKGGYADTQKQLEELKEAAEGLKGTDYATGPIVGSGWKWMRETTNPQSVIIQEAVEQVVQRNLRLILGPQFTKEEGERLIARAFNPRLQEGENLKRLNRLMTQISAAAKAKHDAGEYFSKNRGSLKGYKGKIYTKEDFLNDSQLSDESKKPRAGEAQAQPSTNRKPLGGKPSGKFDPNKFLSK